MASFNILVTGASGYIGGSILSKLLDSQHEVFQRSNIHALIRGDDKAKVLLGKGIKSVLFDDLDESDQLQHIASDYDLVIHTASGFHTGSAIALIQGLGDRKKATGKDVYYIHTTGTSDLADQPITGNYHESRTFSDTEDIYSYLRMRESIEVYAERTTDLAVLQTGLQVGIPTYTIMPPLIYGVGSGLFNRSSIQLPRMLRAALTAKEAGVLGEGKGVWDQVNIADLALLYEIIASKVLGGEKLPEGEKGIYFSANGRFSWNEVAQGIADALVKAGITKESEIRTLGLQEAAEKWIGGNLLLAELAFASNAKTVSDKGRSLGWKPQKGDDDFRRQFRAELQEILRSQ